MYRPTPIRWRIRVRGIVQGVGFRPFVYGLALRWNLAGVVLNDADGVAIEIEGPPAALADFRAAIVAEHPPLARIDSVTYEAIDLVGESSFSITHSQGASQRNTLISPDSATCPDCLRELFDSEDRRYRYPFINCTNCGPRFTIVADVPYDREQTTMSVFPMCPDCRAEYENPLDRRFHAQPNACPACGPHLKLCMATADHSCIAQADSALVAAAQALMDGAIVAIKGLGGYHLACDARNSAAVRQLRERKQREAKPFALMVATTAIAQQLCSINPAEAALLESHRRPIVLLERRPDDSFPTELAPGYASLGIMLPYTPVHALLLDTCASIRPDQPIVLVMTSANLSDEPIAYRDDDALERLSGIADLFLVHNRTILTRCDDSVTRIAAGGEQLFRRSRGYAPEPLALQYTFTQPILAYGGHLKNTFCLARGNQAFVSHHIGDLENIETLQSFREGIAHYQRLFDIVPAAIAYDLHPGYLATQEAQAAAIPLKIGVQHHHAHIASVIVEHGLIGPVIGIAADGTGYGLDGAIWGCEILIADLADFERAGHLAYIPLPGGDQAIRQPWRVAATYLAQVYGPTFLDLGIPFTQNLDTTRWGVLAQMIARNLNSPPTSSLGRLFDAIAALIGLRSDVLYEGQAAIELEVLATQDARPYPFRLTDGAPFQIEVGPMIEAIVADLRSTSDRASIAGRFHATIAAFLVAACQKVRAASGIERVALSGGVFQNRLLLESLFNLLTQDGFRVYAQRRVPTNDGGLSLGQAAVASERIARGRF